MPQTQRRVQNDHNLALTSSQRVRPFPHSRYVEATAPAFSQQAARFLTIGPPAFSQRAARFLTASGTNNLTFRGNFSLNLKLKEVEISAVDNWMKRE
jgi:hypothetical protein